MLGYCSNGIESARMVEVSGSFDVGLVLLCTKNMYVSSLSKHAAVIKFTSGSVYAGVSVCVCFCVAQV